MATKQKILIVDDDTNIAELISLYFTKECYETMIVNDGESVMPAMESFDPNLILLDIMLPGIDGYQVCREVRAKYSVPIIMLSAKGEVFDKVLGLELGADDYISKPFSVKEVVARVRSILRRAGATQEEEKTNCSNRLVYKTLVVDTDKIGCSIDGKEISLTKKEIQMLILFLSNLDKILSTSSPT